MLVKEIPALKRMGINNVTRIRAPLDIISIGSRGNLAVWLVLVCFTSLMASLITRDQLKVVRVGAWNSLGLCWFLPAVASRVVFWAGHVRIRRGPPGNYHAICDAGTLVQNCTLRNKVRICTYETQQYCHNNFGTTPCHLGLIQYNDAVLPVYQIALWR